MSLLPSPGLSLGLCDSGISFHPFSISSLWGGKAEPHFLPGSLSSSDSVFSTELSEQIEKALQLEEERKRAQEEAERLEADRVAALRAKEELERQAQDQIKSQEQLVGLPGFKMLNYGEAVPGESDQ